MFRNTYNLVYSLIHAMLRSRWYFRRNTLTTQFAVKEMQVENLISTKFIKNIKSLETFLFIQHKSIENWKSYV